MKKGVWIYLVILVLVAITVDYFILRPAVFAPANTQIFTSDSSREIFVSGDVVHVDAVTAGSGYYRIRSGNTICEGDNITGNYFFREQAVMPVGHWVLESGSGVSYTIKSALPVSVILVSNAQRYLSTFFITLLLAGMLFVVGWGMSLD
jgi:hypothetical protein